MKKLTSEEQQRITAAIAELEAIGAQSSPIDVQARIRDAGLLLRASLNGQPPTIAQVKLVRVAERIAVWHPQPQPLEDLATDAATRTQVTEWKRRREAAQANAGAAQAALTAKRDEILQLVREKEARDARRTTPDGAVVYMPPTGFALIDAVAAEELRPQEREALLARVALNEVERAFADWRIRAWIEGRLRSTSGD